MILLGQEGLFDVLKRFKQFAHALGDCTTREFVLVLPVPWNHAEDVMCQVSIIEGLHYLGEFGDALGVEQTGQ